MRNFGKWLGRLLVALILVETSDVMFAVDSIPAIFAITRDPFLVFSSNVFAILGLRSLYFLLAAVMVGLLAYQAARNAMEDQLGQVEV